MSDIAEQLTTYLKTISAITDLVGTGANARIFLSFAKQGASLPYIVLEVFEGTSTEHLTGISGLATNRVQVDCYASTKAGASDLAEKVRLAPLQMHRGDMGDLFCNTVRSDGGFRTGYDPASKGANNQRFWSSRDYFITYQEATA